MYHSSTNGTQSLQPTYALGNQSSVPIQQQYPQFPANSRSIPNAPSIRGDDNYRNDNRQQIDNARQGWETYTEQQRNLVSEAQAKHIIDTHPWELVRWLEAKTGTKMSPAITNSAEEKTI